MRDFIIYLDVVELWLSHSPLLAHQQLGNYNSGEVGGAKKIQHKKSTFSQSNPFLVIHSSTG